MKTIPTATSVTRSGVNWLISPSPLREKTPGRSRCQVGQQLSGAREQRGATGRSKTGAGVSARALAPARIATPSRTLHHIPLVGLPPGSTGDGGNVLARPAQGLPR